LTEGAVSDAAGSIGMRGDGISGGRGASRLAFLLGAGRGGVKKGLRRENGSVDAGTDGGDLKQKLERPI